MISAMILAAACGGGCQSYAVRSTYVAPAYVAPLQVYYFVGQSVRADAQLQHKLKSDPLWQEFQQFRAWKEQQQTQAATAPQQSFITLHCAKCHAKAVPEGSFFMDGTSPMDPAAVLKAIRMISTDQMPKDHKLSREEKNQILGELLALDASNQPDPGQPPVSEPPPAPQPQPLPEPPQPEGT